MKRLLFSTVLLTIALQTLWAWDGSGTDTDPYLVKTAADWQQLATDVSGGESYSDKVFRLTQDIDAGGLMVGSDTKPFCGTFDGDNHTLTFNSGTAGVAVATACAPFYHVSGATIRHLNTAGTIYTSAKYAAGIVSQVDGAAPTQLYNCTSAVIISSSVNGDGTHGGLVGLVKDNTGKLEIDRCSFKGQLVMNGGGINTTDCGGFVGYSSSPVSITSSFFSPQNEPNPGRINSGASFARMSDYSLLSLTSCYATRYMSITQGAYLISEIHVPTGCSYEFVGEPVMVIDGTKYYTSGCYVNLTVPETLAFDHWEDNLATTRCYISNPWQRGGLHQLKSLKNTPSLTIMTTAIPTAVTERTLWGVTYRYLSRKDYFYYVSDEDVEAMGWEFYDSSNDANLVVKGVSDRTLVTAVVGYDESGYNSDGVQIHNDLYATLQRDHTHLGIIAPYAFKGSTALTSLYFKDTDGTTEGATTPFKFIIDDEAFANCPNFKELKMMQYTTTGSNQWTALTPDQVVRVADDAFSGSNNLNISAHNQQYQNYLSSDTWKAHRNRFIIYEATVNDFTVEGVKYHYYRNANETSALKNNDEGKNELLSQIRPWNADYQQFNAANLLETDDATVYYCYVTGVDNDNIDSKDGVMRIYNDPGSTYNYKNIALGRDAIAGNTHVKAIEFWQTNGDAANSYSDLKMVIPNGALKGCTNLKELRMFYYVQDGDNHWTTLGPKDVIPGDNIFGTPSIEEMKQMTDEEAKAATFHDDFRILVAPDRINEFLDDPNWQPYTCYIHAEEYSPSGKRDDFSKDGLTYSYIASPGGIMQTSQVVSQNVSWWTVPRIGIEVLLDLAGIAQAWKAAKAAAEAAQAAAAEAAQAAAADAARTASLDVTNLGTALASTQTEKTIFQNAAFKTNVNAGFAKLVEAKNVNNLACFGQVYTQVEAYSTWTTGALNMMKGYGVCNNAGDIIMSQQAFEAMSFYEQKEIFELLYVCSNSYEQAVNAALETAKAQLAQIVAVEPVEAQAVQAGFKESAAKMLTTIPYYANLNTVAGMLASEYWGGSDSYNGDQLQKGMRQNILSNIHQVGLVGGGYVITTPQKNIVYHTAVKSVGDDVTDAVIYAGFDKDGDNNTSNITTTCAKKAFQNKTNLKTVRFHDNNDQSSNKSTAMLFTIPDSAFVGCTALTEFSTLLQTEDNGTRALGPENFILAGDNIFEGLDPATFHIVIDPRRKQDFLDNESWAPLEKFFVYESAAPVSKYNEYGGQYAYAYENNSVKKEHKEKGHLIEHTTVIGADDDFLKSHQGALKLCNDIGIYNNYQLDDVMAEAFKGNLNLRSVSFTDLKGRGFAGDVYTGLRMHIGDRAFQNCTNLADIAMLYMVTDGLNRLDAIKPSMVSIGEDVFDGTTARIKMMPQQVEWFEADTAWVKYKDRFQPCIIKVTDDGVKKALGDMAFYDPAATGLDQSKWGDYIDYARIGGKGFDWLDGRFTAQRDKIRSFNDFRWFESVGLDYVGESWFEGCSNLASIVLPSTAKKIHQNAFKDCTNLREIDLPAEVWDILDGAFAGCTALNTIVVRREQPCYITSDAIDKHDGLKIYVPAAQVDNYKTNPYWKEYADYIVGDDTYKINKVVTVTAVGQLADKLGLTLVKESGKVRYLQGNYAKYDSLTVTGPLNGEDMAVIRHLAGANAYDSDATDGQLKYLNLWNADIKKDTEHSYNGNWLDEHINKDNRVPNYLFENCAMIETVILPKSATEIGENVFEEAKGLKRVCVGLNTTSYDTDLLQDIEGLQELSLITTGFASNTSIYTDPWEADIMQVWTLPSQTGNYLGDPKLTKRAHNICAPLRQDAVMLALAEAGYFFPTDYMQIERAEGIFNGNLKITDFKDFQYLQKVKRLESTFKDMTMLEEINLPGSIEQIDAEAFSSCNNLHTIRISSAKVIEPEEEGGEVKYIPPTLAENAFIDLPEDFQILVPKKLCKLYRAEWKQYADHINPDTDNSSNNDLIEVTLTKPNTLAEKLGLTQTIRSSLGAKWVNGLKGDYSRITRLKVSGPISGADFDVLRYLAGYCPWANCRNYSGHLQYLDLYDAQITQSDVNVKGYIRSASTFTEEMHFLNVVDNVMPMHGLLRAYSLNTLILPRTCTKVLERALQECEGLEVLVLGDDIEDFNWNALDDDAMLTRMYILAKKKMEISTELGLFRWLSNNYNPTFDAMYVRPSLYNDYLNDDTYTGTWWQRTNSISKGIFTDDASFAVFASHAAATADDLLSVNSVDGWFKNHTDASDLTALGLTSVSTLRAEDMQQLPQLEKVAVPATLETIEAAAFSQSPNLRYVDGLLASNVLVSDIQEQGLASLGIDTQKTLVYLPSTYTGEQGTNIVINNGGTMTAKTFRLVDDKDYCVPYAFTAARVENSRKLSGKNKSFSAFLPYELTLDASVAKVYKPTSRDGSVVTFTQVADGRMEALKPYVIRLTGKKATLDVDATCTIPASTGSLVTSASEWDVPGYTMRGTVSDIDNATAAELGALVLGNGQWTAVTKDGKTNVAPFRAYMLQSGNSGAPSLTMEFTDDETTGIDSLTPSPSPKGEGSDYLYTLDGRRLNGKPTQKGIYIYKGKKIIKK